MGGRRRTSAKSASPQAAADLGAARPGCARLGVVSDRAEHVHTQRNLLATILGNLDYACALAQANSLAADERRDLAEALSHARIAAAKLLAEIERFG